MQLLKLFLVFYVYFSAHAWAGDALNTLNHLPHSSLLVVDRDNNVLHAKNPDQSFIPASTVKLLTALIALDSWGSEYRFSTEFYIDTATNILWVKGLGDPYLVSEELDIIAERLHGIGIRTLQGIGVDAHYFNEGIYFDGHGKTDNPYDAAVSALAVNFNTVNIRVSGGRVRSAEPQTPLTLLARTIGAELSDGIHRVNLGQSKRGPQYFAEVFLTKLNELGIDAGTSVIHGPLPLDSKLLFEHFNSRNLEQIVAAMLEYSNNFIANQLYLLLGAKYYGEPVSVKKSQNVYADYIKTNFQWQKYVVVEGAGLSKDNRLNARQLADVLRAFGEYRHLMPLQNKKIRAKTGTLKNVSTYAGYIKRNQEWLLFALMINQPVNYFFREKVAEELLSVK